MVAFNPDVPEGQPPSYLNLAKPVENFELKSVGGTIAKGVGDVVQSASTGAVNVIQSLIDRALYSGVDTQRDALTGGLETATGVSPSDRVGTQPDATATPPQSLTAGAPAPAGIDQGLSKADRINQAKLQNLDASTYYEGRLINIARDLRSTWGEGFRPYIDQKMSEISGGNPANVYVQKLMQTYTEMQKGQGDDREKWIGFIRQHSDDTPGAQKVYDDFVAGKIGPPGILNWVNDYKSIDMEAARKAHERSLKTIPREQAAVEAGDDYNKILDKTFETNWRQTLARIGYSPEQLNDIADKINAGEEIPGLDNVALTNIGLAIKSAGKNVERQMKNLSVNNYGNGGLTIEDLIKPEEVDKRIASKMAAWHDVGNKFLDEKTGAAFHTASTVDAIIRNIDSELFKDESVGRFVGLNTTLAKRGGLGAEVLIKSLGPNFQMGAKMEKFLAASSVPEILIQPDPNNPRTTKDIVDKLQKRSSNDPNMPSTVAAVIGGLPQTIVNNPKMPDWQKVNVVKGTISAANTGVISKVKDDYVDDKGNFVIGQHTLFNQNTSKPMIDEIWRLSQGNPTLWPSAKQWVESEQEKIAGEDMRNLNVYAANPNMKFHYDMDSHRLVVDYVPRKGNIIDERGMGFDLGVRHAQAAADKLNSTFPALVNIAEKEGRDPNAYILQRMLGMGIDPNNVAVGQVLGAMSSAAPKVSDPFGNKDKNKNQDRVK